MDLKSELEKLRSSPPVMAYAAMTLSPPLGTRGTLELISLVCYWHVLEFAASAGMTGDQVLKILQKACSRTVPEALN